MFKPLQQWVLDMIARKPSAIFLVAGDFNCAYKPIQHLHELSLSEITFRRVVLGEKRQIRILNVVLAHSQSLNTISLDRLLRPLCYHRVY